MLGVVLGRYIQGGATFKGALLFSVYSTCIIIYIHVLVASELYNAHMYIYMHEKHYN